MEAQPPKPSTHASCMGKVQGAYRSYLERALYVYGLVVHRFAGYIVTLGFLLLAVLACGLLDARTENDIAKLWVEKDGFLSDQLGKAARQAPPPRTSSNTWPPPTLGGSDRERKERESKAEMDRKVQEAVQRYRRSKEDDDFSEDNSADFSANYAFIMQTGANKDENLLDQRAVKFHLAAAKKIADVKVRLFGRTFGFFDVCSHMKISFDPAQPTLRQMRKIIERCIAITPLDCFWDGADALTPPEFQFNFPFLTDFGAIPDLSWKTLNPFKLAELLDKIPNAGIIFTFGNSELAWSIPWIIRKYNITGYTGLPCLDSEDGECPGEKGVPVNEVLSKDCRFVFNSLMSWPRDLIVGGSESHPNGTLRSAKGLQTVYLLQSAKEIYREMLKYKDERVVDIDWSIEKAQLVLDTWQEEFVRTVMEDVEPRSQRYRMTVFTGPTLIKVLTDIGDSSIGRVVMGYIIMFVYACASLAKWRDPVRSQTGLAMGGVALVLASCAAGLGLASSRSMGNVPLNAISKQALPFLALGLGVDDMFLLAHTYSDLVKHNLVPYEVK